ncbi:MAG TPA: glycosyltransferase [Thermomicrobiales bacterium]|nr:glycosyltransferase [Thermomicrobiales bacterium]
MKRIITLFTLVQSVLAIRVFYRMAVTADSKRVRRDPHLRDLGRVSVIVPVLNEVDRLSPCLDGLTSQGVEVAEILVVDGGSTDGTPDLVRHWETLDDRVCLIQAGPVFHGSNGKAHGMQVGLEHSKPENGWVLTIDADVRPAPLLVCSLLAHASDEQVPALSAATLQSLSGAAEGLVHPSMLTTLVYRFGIPGHATQRVDQVQANGQCFLVQREVLEAVGAFASVADSICEDVTLARTIAARGYPVGFYEVDGLVSVQMYNGWQDAWDNWTRSLPMRDGFTRWWSALGLAEVMAVQALPLWLVPLYRWRAGDPRFATVLNIALLLSRVGVLVGVSRAYSRRPWTYWLSSLCDLPVAFRLWYMWGRRRHFWRGREIISGHSS